MENQQAPVISTKDWVITLLIRIIPLVGFIMLIVWAVGNGENPNKQNWAKAMLIIIAIGFVLSVIFFAIFGGLIFAALMKAREGMPDSY